MSFSIDCTIPISHHFCQWKRYSSTPCPIWNTIKKKHQTASLVVLSIDLDKLTYQIFILSTSAFWSFINHSQFLLNITRHVNFCIKNSSLLHKSIINWNPIQLVSIYRIATNTCYLLLLSEYISPFLDFLGSTHSPILSQTQFEVFYIQRSLFSTNPINIPTSTHNPFISLLLKPKTSPLIQTEPSKNRIFFFPFQIVTGK